MKKINTGSHDLPVPAGLDEFMRTGWLDSSLQHELADFAPYTAARRARLHEQFPGERLVIPAGTYKQRSNDQDYRFRAHSAYVWLTGDQSSDGVCVIERDGTEMLYLRPRSNRENGEFYRDRKYGELWAGRRASLAETHDLLGIATRHIDELASYATDRVLGEDVELTSALSELRLIKDEWEIAELQRAVDITTRGFEDVVRAIPAALTLGERHLEVTFWSRARQEGHDVGYHTIVGGGAHAATLHWIENDGPVREGELILLDAGAETRNLYTADITRVLPVSGRFTPLQRDLYELSRRANDAAIATLKPGASYRDFHAAAMTVMAHGLADLGVLPVSAEQALEEDNGMHRRWTLCGSGHMLGLDVHDCAQARAETYLDGVLAPGMVLTVEPGVYFQPDDALIPAEMRGMGFRIEEDILITEDGYRILSDALPRSASDVESWMQRVATS